jgi:hypothetical protein
MVDFHWGQSTIYLFFYHLDFAKIRFFWGKISKYKIGLGKLYVFYHVCLVKDVD